MTKTINHGLSLFFSVVLILSVLTGAALADVIWEPENDFYAAHAEDCEYINTQYYSNGSSGYMEIFDKPDGSGLGFSDNGKLYYVSFSYNSDGIDWGVIEYSKSGDRLIPADYTTDTKYGWIKLSDTLAKYDSASFRADHSGEIAEFSGDAAALVEQEQIAAWTYPNSGELYGTITDIDEDFTQGFSESYTDELGRKWAFCGYYRGMRNFWVCLDAPSDDTLPAVNTPELTFIQPKSDELPQQTGAETSRMIALWVCIVAAISCAMIAIMGSKKKNKKQ